MAVRTTAAILGAGAPMTSIRTMLWSVGLSLITGTFAVAATPDDNDVDANLPQHKNVCKDGFVSRKKLAYQLLVNIKNTRAVVRISGGPELWHTIYTDENFCPVKSKIACAKDSKSTTCKEAMECESDQIDATNSGVAFFSALNINVRTSTPAFNPGRRLRALHTGADPFSGASDQLNLFFSPVTAYSDKNDGNEIICTAKDAPQPPPPYNAASDTSALSKLRVRGLSDDLYIDRLQGNFKATTAASGNFTSNTLAVHTTTTKATAALGYAFDAIPQTQIVPYFSFNQSITGTAGKPGVLDPTNNVALGVVAERYFIDPNSPAISHVFSVKPQFLLNTADQSELASMRLIYAPWIDSAVFNLNTFRKLDFLPGSTWGEIVFDLRNDSGVYTNRGNTPAIVGVNRNFDRAGTRIGVALTTDNFPSLTLLITETYLYGFSGYYRSIDMFQASLTYNIVNNYLGLTASYKKGRDEDTAVSSQIWTVGLTARY
jgi:hypothetical protein